MIYVPVLGCFLFSRQHATNHHFRSGAVGASNKNEEVSKMGLIYKVSRTRISVRGHKNESGLRDSFDELRNERRISMHTEYDKKTDMTNILLAPCLVSDEYAASLDGPYCARIVFELDRFVVPGILRTDWRGNNLFIKKVWLKYKKKHTKDAVVLPSVYERNGSVVFELIVDDSACAETISGRKIRIATSAEFRTEAMNDAKLFFMNYFASKIENAHASMAARIMENFTMDFAELAFSEAELIDFYEEAAKA